MAQTKHIYTVLVGDLKGSKKIPDRPKTARMIARSIATIGKKFRKEFYAPPALTSGMDEIAGILKNPGAAYRICREINYRIFPERFRFAIVRGELDVNLRTKDAGKIDGPAFHMAAREMQKLKRSNLFYSFVLNVNEKSDHSLLSEIANLVTIILQQRTTRQNEIVLDYKKTGRQVVTAKRLGITQQAVSASLGALRWDYIQKVEKVIDDILEKAIY